MPNESGGNPDNPGLRERVKEYLSRVAIVRTGGLFNGDTPVKLKNDQVFEEKIKSLLTSDGMVAGIEALIQSERDQAVRACLERIVKRTDYILKDKPLEAVTVSDIIDEELQHLEANESN